MCHPLWSKRVILNEVKDLGLLKKSRKEDELLRFAQHDTRVESSRSMNVMAEPRTVTGEDR